MTSGFSTPIEVMYLRMFSSAVPSQLVFSISQARHDGIARVAATMSASTFPMGEKVSPTDDLDTPLGPWPAIVVAAGSTGGLRMSLAKWGAGGSRMNQLGPPSVRRIPSVSSQSCQGISSGISRMGGQKG